MKVLHFITRLIIGGAQQNTLLNVEDQYRDYDDEVSLVCGPGLGPEGSLVERAQAGGFELRLLPSLERNIKPWGDWSSYRQLIDIIRELQPEIIHTHSSKAGIMGRAAAAKLKIPAVHSIHGAAFHYGQPWLARNIYLSAEKWAGPKTTRYISVCDAMTDQYVEAGVAPREKFVTIYSGMEVEPFLDPPRPPAEVRRELGLTDEQVVIGKVARLFHLKGHEFVLQAARRVIDAAPNVRFLFVGDGILREQYEREIAEAGLTDYFVFAGLVRPERIPELVAAMDVVVHTSMWEGLARVLPQGSIAGKPVVSYDIDGAREVVIPDETGFLLPRGAVDELADALVTLATDAELRQRLGTTGRERFTDQFRHQTMTRKIREVYAEILGR